MRTDIFGNEIFIGDDVVITEPYYHNFVNAQVVKFTPKGFRVRCMCKNYYGKERETVVFAVVKGKMKNE